MKKRRSRTRRSRRCGSTSSQREVASIQVAFPTSTHRQPQSPPRSSSKLNSRFPTSEGCVFQNLLVHLSKFILVLRLLLLRGGCQILSLENRSKDLIENNKKLLNKIQQLEKTEADAGAEIDTLRQENTRLVTQADSLSSTVVSQSSLIIGLRTTLQKLNVRLLVSARL